VTLSNVTGGAMISDATGVGTITDDDTNGFTITESDGSTFVIDGTGPGDTDDLTVVLNAQPLGNVVLDVSSGDTGEFTASPTQLTFDNTNWSVPQTVSVFGVADDVVDGDQIVDLSVAIDQPLTTDNAFDGLATQTVPVTVVDIEVAGFDLNDTGVSTEPVEGGATDSISVALQGPPASDVVVDIFSANPGQADVAPIQLTFTSSDWMIPQYVAVTAVNDVANDGDVPVNIVFSINDALSDDAWDPIGDLPRSIVAIDNDP
jgi:hypothetical protein